MRKTVKKMKNDFFTQEHFTTNPTADLRSHDLIPVNENMAMNDSIERIILLKKLGNLRHIRKEVGDETIRKLIMEVYPAHTITELENLLRIPDSTLGFWFKQLEIPFIRHHATNTSFAGDFDYKTTLSNGKTATIFSNIEITPYLAYLIGFTLGDGNVQKYMVEVFNKDRALREFIYPIIKSYGTVMEEERPNGLWRLRLSSIKIADLIRDKNGNREDTIDYILRDNNLARQFIAAFWDAEGTVRKQYNHTHIYLYNTNKQLLDKIGEFLTNKGIKFTWHSRFDNNRIYFYKGRQIISRKPMHRMCVPKPSMLTWVNEIGVHMKHSKKSVVVNEILNQKYGG